jgi:hypothetical protein
MRDLLNEGQVLGREEMKKIMAGSTNCIICPSGHECKEFDGSAPPSGCSWGECDC